MASALSNASGVNGNLFLYILYKMFHFYFHEAIPLSSILIFTGSLISFILNASINHPKRKTKAIEYNLIICIAPNLFFGAFLGVTINKIISNLLVIILVAGILGYNTYKSIKM
ncbi:MAG: hypothetical protein MJ252_01465 [archaeon]|nr:hypothetical protein [archaeon]